MTDPIKTCQTPASPSHLSLSSPLQIPSGSKNNGRLVSPLLKTTEMPKNEPFARMHSAINSNKTTLCALATLFVGAAYNWTPQQISSDSSTVATKLPPQLPSNSFYAMASLPPIPSILETSPFPDLEVPAVCLQQPALERLLCVGELLFEPKKPSFTIFSSLAKTYTAANESVFAHFAIACQNPNSLRIYDFMHLQIIHSDGLKGNIEEAVDFRNRISGRREMNNLPNTEWHALTSHMIDQYNSTKN